MHVHRQNFNHFHHFYPVKLQAGLFFHLNDTKTLNVSAALTHHWRKNHFEKKSVNCLFLVIAAVLVFSCSVKPSLIEYLSYNLNFLSILVGPCSNYKDYVDFIEGRHISQRLKQHSGMCNGHSKTPDLSPLVSSWRNLNAAAFCFSVKILIF